MYLSEIEFLTKCGLCCGCESFFQKFVSRKCMKKGILWQPESLGSNRFRILGKRSDDISPSAADVWLEAVSDPNPEQVVVGPCGLIYFRIENIYR
jgi:hypothetical protein